MPEKTLIFTPSISTLDECVNSSTEAQSLVKLQEISQDTLFHVFQSDKFSEECFQHM